jgi:hypothetical protein
MIKLKTILEESKVSGKTIINVDIQHSYEKYIPWLSQWVDFVNENFDRNTNVFVWNGTDLGMESKGQHQNWLFDIGVSEDVINQSDYVEKSYGFFRSCMDRGFGDDNIIALGEYMYKNRIYDSRDLGEDDWAKLERKLDDDIVEFLLDGDDPLIIPDVLFDLKRYSNILLTGGGDRECLAEIRLCLDILNKPHKDHGKFIY